MIPSMISTTPEVIQQPRIIRLEVINRLKDEGGGVVGGGKGRGLGGGGDGRLDGEGVRQRAVRWQRA